jgi:F0F1-type ATP synthase assembly protein I
MSDPEKNSSTMRYIGLGSQLMAMLLAAVWIGWKLDKWTGWKFPVFIITLPLAALGLSLWQLIRAFNKPNK